MNSTNEKHATTILHVEDDEAIRVSLGFAFADEGYIVHEVFNGQDALDFLSTHSSEIDLIFLDVMMPVMDGFTFCAHRSRDRAIADIPTIIYSADEGNMSKAAAIGLPFISKPFNLDHVLDEITKYARK